MSPDPIWIHPSRQMTAMAELRREALPSGAIPHLFHYERLRQSQLWLEVARKYAPDVEATYRQVFQTAREWCGNAPVHLVGLGAGGARKERWLLEKLENPRFTPVDVSDSLALQSTQHVRDLTGKPPKPLVADILEFPGLPDWLGEFDSGRKRLFTAFGLTPNTSPKALLPALRGFLRPGDALLVSANLFNDETWVLAEYDNAETRAWLTQTLIDWGIREILGEPTFRWGEIDGQRAIIAESRWLQDCDFPWEGEMFHVKQSRVLRLFFSIRYTVPGFETELAKHDFRVLSAVESGCGREGIWLVES